MSAFSQNPFALLGDDDGFDNLPQEVKQSKPITTPSAPPASTPASKPKINQAPRPNRGGRYPSRGGSKAVVQQDVAPAGTIPDDVTNRKRERAERGRGRGRGTPSGGRQGRGGFERKDRQSATGIEDHQKQADAAWGSTEGSKALDDEAAADADATKDLNAAKTGDVAVVNVKADDTPQEKISQHVPVVEEVDNTRTLDEYLAELKTSRQRPLADTAKRAANEGNESLFKNATQVVRNIEEENYFAAAKADYNQRSKTKKEKVVLEIEGRFAPTSDRGGRGRAARGGFRGDRGGDRNANDRGGKRGDVRGGRSQGPRVRGESGVNMDDQTAFPSLA